MDEIKEKNAESKLPYFASYKTCFSFSGSALDVTGRATSHPTP